jgi:surface protein
MESMFSGATTFNNGADPGAGGVPFTRTVGSIWDTKNVTTMGSMFFGCAAFNQNVSQFDTHSVLNMSSMFEDATTFNNGAESGVGGVPFTRTVGSIWDTGKVRDMNYMFQGCASFNQNVSQFDTFSVENMGFMFNHATTFNNGALPGAGGVPFTRTAGSIWDTGKVLNMAVMFANCRAFNQNVSSWDTFSVLDMAQMFFGATTFNNGALPGVGGVPFIRTAGSIWDTSKVFIMGQMFRNCAAFNQNVSQFDTHLVENMLQMFAGATTFNNGALPGVGGVPFTRTANSIWDTGKVLIMGGMFYDCAAFNQNVSQFDTHLVETMQQMFAGATLFVGTGVDTWQLTLKPPILEMFLGTAVPSSVNNNLIWNTWQTNYAYSSTDLAAAGLIEPVPTPTPTPTPTPRPPIVSDICFPAGTPIKTDQGVIPIELLAPGQHTIRGQTIEHITQTVTVDKYLIAFLPNALDYKVPNKKTIMSKDHCIIFKGQLVPAYRFLDYSDQVKKVTYSGEVLYNVLLSTHGMIEVNNMKCETLHPANAIAQMYRAKNNALPKTIHKYTAQPPAKKTLQKY